MRALSLRFRFRPTKRGSGSGDGATDSGLLAFAPEGQSGGPGSTHPPGLTWTGRRSHVIIGLLAALVVLQAVPTALWLKSRLKPATALAAMPTVVAPPPAPVVAVPPCETAATSGKSETAAAAPAAAAKTPAPAPAPPPAMVAGLLAISAPVPMRVYAKGKLVGTTEAETIMLPVGSHELTLESEATGFKATRTVSVQAGRTTQVNLEPPSGTVHVNAVPWADVWIDDRRVGGTPIGNLQAPIGTREVVFRHPELGERRATVLVTLNGPARISMDMRAK